MDYADIKTILQSFTMEGSVAEIKALGNGLINDTYKITTAEEGPDYVLQRINNAVFTDVDLLQHNIEVVTDHIRRKLIEQNEDDIDRKVLRFVRTKDGKTYTQDERQQYWRLAVFIPRSVTMEAVTPESSRFAGQAFGRFEAMLTDVPETLGETIPDFHNMGFRLQQLREAVGADKRGRVAEVRPLLDEIEAHADEMCFAERLHQAGKLPKRLCHCDTKVNNMLFDEDGNVLCVIDLDTVMPSYVFSDFGDFMRTAANFTTEEDPELDHVGFNMDIYKAFTEGYLQSAGVFLTEEETSHLPLAAAMFPFMQAVRFLADYLNGDTYYKIKYPEHNLNRAKNQLRLFEDVMRKLPEMNDYLQELRK